MSSNFDYQNKTSPKLSEEFKDNFVVNLRGKDTVKLEGLTALGHQKGIWKMNTEIIQYPSAENKWTAICKTTLGGYDWDPITEKIREVEYSDIGDANPENCTGPVSKSYIRMASTRSQGRALRKYTNVDVVFDYEMSTITTDAPEPSEQPMSNTQGTVLRNILATKKIGKTKFQEILMKLFNTDDYQNLTRHDGDILIETLNNYIAEE